MKFINLKKTKNGFKVGSRPKLPRPPTVTHPGKNRKQCHPPAAHATLSEIKSIGGPMERRDFLSATAAVAGGAVIGKAHASQSAHKHHKMIKSTLSSQEQASILQSTRECIAAGNACVAHCARSLASGSTMMAECNLAVQSMLPLTQAMNQVAQLNSAKKERISALASACMKFCEDCLAACEPHTKMHEECRKCAEACKSCIKACKKIA